jgi:hypothetical protein
MTRREILGVVKCYHLLWYVVLCAVLCCSVEQSSFVMCCGMMCCEV